TRGSAMALFQAGLVRDRLREAHPELAHDDAIEIVPIRTTGDRIQTRLLAEIGGKGLFTKEIEEALLDRRIDVAVHSLKDMETRLPAGLEIGCILPRDDPRDVLVSRTGVRLAQLPNGARVGTASLRRTAQLLRVRPDLAIAPIRGNVGTRLDKLAAGEIDALVLALCGLERLGKADVASEILSPEEMLPAVGQGALAVECRAGEAELQRLLAPLNDATSAACVAAERAMLAALDGSCRTPIGGLATIADGRLTLQGLLLSEDGNAERRGRGEGAVGDAVEIGTELGLRLKRGAGPGFGLG
ncbi:MAG TPA: hydroxymethylbilane synthase, partial [Stellaceae bacterium]